MMVMRVRIDVNVLRAVATAPPGTRVFFVNGHIYFVSERGIRMAETIAST